MYFPGKREHASFFNDRQIWFLEQRAQGAEDTPLYNQILCESENTEEAQGEMERDREVPLCMLQ